MTDPRAGADLYLGVDIGGTVAKAALFDAAGIEIAVAASEQPGTFPEPGYAERRTDGMWDTAVAAIRAVLDEPGASADRIAALCITGHGNGVYLVDRAGAPVGPGILAIDARAAGLLAVMRRDGRAEAVERIIAKRINVGQTSLLLAWISAFEPERAQAAAHALLAKDYLRWRLTGRLATDPNDSSGSGLMNLRTGAYDPALWEAFGAPGWHEKLPAEILPGSAVAGRVTEVAARLTGLRAGTPVATGTMDIEAIRLASGVLDPDHLMVSAGTWSVNLTVSDTPRLEGPPPGYQGLSDDGRRYFLAEATPTGATNLAWFRRTVIDGSALDFDAINALVGGLDPRRCEVVYLPYIHGGSGEPRAAFVGLTADGGKAHLLRAIYEGICCNHRGHVDALAAVLGRRPRIARFSGGAARSAVWAQLMADTLDMPVETIAAAELGALGAAICAAVAVGRFADTRAAVTAMVRPAGRFEPDPGAVAVHAVKYARHRAVLEALGPAWALFGRED
jgi:L-xylulokinase